MEEFFVPYDPFVRRALFITLGFLACAGIVLVVAVTTTSDEPSPIVMWAAFAGTLTALVAILVLESGGRRR